MDDLIEGIYRLVMDDRAQAVNIGNPNEITISYFAREVIMFVGTRQKLVFKKLLVSDPPQRHPDFSKADSIFDWEPKFLRDEGLNRTCELLQSLIEERLYRKERRNFSQYTKYNSFS